MFIVGMATIVAGYTLMYYGIDMMVAYQRGGTTGGIPLSVLFGVKSVASGTKSGAATYSKPPFDLTGSQNAQGGTTPSSSTATPSTGGGVQAV